MSGGNLLNRLKLYDYKLFNDEICAKSLLKTDSFVSDINGNLSCHRESTQHQLMSKG